MGSNVFLVAGTYTADLILAGIDRLAGPGEVLYLDRPVELRPGGHAVNVAVDSARLGFPGRIISVGAVGRDLFGDVLVRAVESAGAEAAVERVEGAGTARNLIIALRGEDRRFHVYHGANRLLSGGHVARLVSEARPSHIYMSLGFSKSLDTQAPGILTVARSIGSTVMIDPAYTRRESVEPLKPVIGLADVIHLNMDELSMLSPPGGLEGLKALASRLPRSLVTVTSSTGVMAAYMGRLIRQPSFKIDPVDPTGAGDAFCSGLMVALASKRLKPGEASVDEIVEALAYAQAAGAAAVSHVGASEGVAKEIVEDLLSRQGEGILAETTVESL